MENLEFPRVLLKGVTALFYVRGCTDLPRLASYVFMYSLVMNCETRAVFPTPESPSKITLYFEIVSSMSLSVLASCPLQQEPSNGDFSPETLLFLEAEEKKNIENCDDQNKIFEILIQSVSVINNIIKMAKKIIF